MLTVILRQLESADFANFNVIRHGKYVELCELSLKITKWKLRLSADSKLKCSVKLLLKNENKKSVMD